jgi:ActR/RegA family two-component response regulator
MATTARGEAPSVRTALVVDEHEGQRERLISDFSQLRVRAAGVAPAAATPDVASRFDLLVVDGGRQGTAELVRRLREPARAARIAVLTSYPSFQDSFAAGQRGADCYLVKPMSGAEVIWAALGRRLPPVEEDTAPPSLERYKRFYIEWVLDLHGGNKTRAAQHLQIPRYTLQRMLSRFPPSR